MINGIDDVVDNYMMPAIENDRHSAFTRLQNDQIRLAPRLSRSTPVSPKRPTSGNQWGGFLRRTTSV
jgi:hypothetical protein